jgi:hypothetical protein
MQNETYHTYKNQTQTIHNGTLHFWILSWITRVYVLIYNFLIIVPIKHSISQTKHLSKKFLLGPQITLHHYFNNNLLFSNL